ncbi:MAG: PAS domain-containing sensor histidine kinase [Marivibrio sp.]|uniref:sensor histidine kinase n=1 Tax=Marivibrio sp. TaxID=2039719 RepID=UPI0032EFFEA6
MWLPDDHQTCGGDADARASTPARPANATPGETVRWSSPDVKALADNSELGVLICAVDSAADHACSILYANQGFCEMTGYTADELKGASPKMFQSAETDRATLDRVRAALEAGPSASFELCNRDRAGRPYWVSVEMIPVGRDGARMIYAAFERDITQERAQRQALADYVDAVRTAERETGRGFWRFTPETGRLWLSPEARRTLALSGAGTLDEAIDLSALMAALDPKDGPAVVAAMHEAVQFGRAFSHVAGQDARLLRFRGRLDAGSGGAVLVGDVELVTDEAARITTLEQELAAQHTAIEAKNRFLAMMSHELRTPLNAIIGFSELGLALAGDAAPQDAGPDKIQGYLHDILASGRSLKEIVDSVLNASRFDLGRIPMTPEPFRVRPVIEEVWRRSGAAVDAPPRLVLDVPETLVLDADPNLMRQAWTNLFANALRYGAGDSVTAGAARTRDALILYVENDGPIIPEEIVSTFGVPFVRSGEDETRAQNKGIGLGLYVCSEIAKLHGGFLYVDRERERGARLGLAVPVEREIVDPAAPAPLVEPARSVEDPAPSPRKPGETQ